MSRRKSHRNEALVGGLLLLAALVFTWMSVQVGALKSFGDTIRVTATFHDAAGLVPDAAVKVAGVKVGAVSDLKVDFDRAVVTFVLQRSAGLRTDVRAQVRARSLLGEKYVALTPRSKDAPLLADGGTIEGTVASVDIDELVTALGPLLQEVKPADMAKLVEAAGALLAAAGNEAPELLARSRSLLTKLDAAADAAPKLTQDVEALVGELRGATGQLRATMGRVDALLVRADGLVDAVQGAANDVPALVTDLRGVVDQIEPGLDDLRAAMEQSDEALAQLRTILKNAEGLDAEAVRRLMREEGILIRVKPTHEAPD